MSNSSIMSIQEMIDAAFGEADKNIVNFKLIHSIMYILARQLRLLQRRVEVEIDPLTAPVSSTLLITEVKLRANVPKKKKKLIKTAEQNKRDIVTRKSLVEKTIFDKPRISSVKSETDKSSELTTSKSSEKMSSKSTTDKTTTSSSLKTSTTLSSSTKTTTENSTQQSSTEKSSSDRTKSSSDRTKSSSDRTSTKDISDKQFSEDYRKKFFSNDYQRLLESIEQKREQELRVVNQRADSREEAKQTPTPMASLDEIEVQYEKLLIVERAPTDTREKTGRSRDRKEQPLSVVTQDQFDTLANLVKELHEKFGVVGKAEFPENIQLMQDLRRGASLTDAMAALQLSARIEAAEKTLEQMMSLVTNLAVSKGVDIESMPEKDSESPETEVLFGAVGPTSQVPPKITRQSTAFKQPRKRKSTSAAKSHDNLESFSIAVSGEALQHIATNYENPQTVDEIDEIDTGGPKVKPDWITPEELDDAIELLYDSLSKEITNSTSKSSSSADSALKIATRLERKIDGALNLDTRMDDLETLVSEYAGQINTLDTGLSSYMTDYQEQLTQMQHDLEGGLESMAEAMANTGGDTAAVAELNNNITNLQMDFEATSVKQKKLKDQQTLLFADVENLWKQIEILRGTKSDREEAADALRDKAGLGALNGLVSQVQFDAVRGDFEKRIGAAYDKFNNQEIIWQNGPEKNLCLQFEIIQEQEASKEEQSFTEIKATIQKAIDDLLRELNEKADWLQVSSFREDVNDNLEKLRKQINEIMDIVGEPHAAATAKKLFHDTACLSCSSPAHMNLEEPDLIPALPAFPKPGTRPSTIAEEDKSKPKEDGDHNVCYPGHPIPHPRDSRSHVCQRYCGGSHTIISGGLSRAPVGMIITPVIRRVTTEIGTDGRVYLTDEPELINKPCLPCNLPKPATEAEPSEAEEVPTNKIMSASPSLDYLIPTGSMTMPRQESTSITPPPPLDE